MKPPRLRRCLWLGALLLFACAVAPASAGEYRTVETESLRIIFDSEWAARTAPGYLPVRFDITNLGEAREIEIIGQGMRYFMMRYGGQIGAAVRQPVRLARGDRVRLTIAVPIYADSENIHFEIREDGRLIERFAYTGFQSRIRPDDASALIVADPASTFGKMAAGWPRTATVTGSTRTIVSGSVTTSGSSTGHVMVARPAGSGTAGGPTHPLDFMLAPARLPVNWLGFTSLRAVVIGPQEWSQLADAQKSALLTWTACGGDLLFVDGSLSALLPDAKDAPLPPDRPVRAYFFGRIHLLSSTSIAATGLADALSKAAALQDANWSLPANRTADWGVIAARGFRLPIPGVEGVPARAYLLILILFSLLIGPINYWLLRRMRQQVLLVLTTPLISALFILLLAGYVLAGEGLGVRGRAMTFTMLDQVRRQAVTRASASLYAAGMTPRGGLRFGRDEAVFPIGPEGSGSRESMTMDLTESQRFAAGVINARSPTNLETIGFRAARERLGFEREAGGLRVVNGLGTAIRTLIYRDGKTVYHLARPLPPGDKGILEPRGPSAADVVPPGLPLTSRFQHLFANPPDGAYLAVLERSPFWSSGVGHVDERGSFHVVIGWIGGQP